MIKHAVLACIMGFAVLLPSAVHASPQETILHRFRGGPGGTSPSALVMDSTGALYGTTAGGGDAGCGAPRRTGCGTVFKLTPPVTGQTAWTFQVLFNLPGGNDGYNPVGLSIDLNGDLFGVTTLAGGCFDCGAVFMLTPPSLGQTKWSYQVLHRFIAGTDGANPTAPPTVSRSGVLYGSTSVGGTGHTCPDLADGDCGTVYRLTPPVGGGSSWSYAVIYRFKGNSSGNGPIGGLYEAPNGTLYGTTIDGGLPADCAGGCGTVFSLQPGSGGSGSIYSVIHRFGGSGKAGGEYPNNGLTGDSAGNLYGVVGCESTKPCGSVFELKAPVVGQSSWTPVSIQHFAGNLNGGVPNAVIMSTNGALYGTTTNGGYGCASYSGCGVVFELTPPPAGQTGFWPLHVLHRFLAGQDGRAPEGNLIEDAQGHLFGSTTAGGAGCAGNNCGEVFEIVP
jgi:uncharacterized repeat protein (TIGR03803 family)